MFIMIRVIAIYSILQCYIPRVIVYISTKNTNF